MIISKNKLLILILAMFFLKNHGLGQNCEWKKKIIAADWFYLSYISGEPIFMDSFPVNMVYPQEFKGLKKNKWAKIPIKIVEVKVTESALRFMSPIILSDTSKYVFKGIKYVLIPYWSSYLERKIKKLYEKKRLFYIVGGNQYDTNNDLYFDMIISMNMLELKQKYSGFLKQFPRKTDLD